MRKLRRFLELSFDERLLFMQALLLLPIARFALWSTGFNRTHSLLARLFPLRPSTLAETSAEHGAKATMRMVATAAAHGVCRATCLPRSLAAFSLLRRQGIDAQLRLGARKKAGAFEAHAWIALGSMTLDSEGSGLDGPFVPFSGSPRLNEFSGAAH